MIDESWVLPVVMKYDGKPVVTSDGHIVYLFEELMKTATVERGLPSPVMSPTMKEEEKESCLMEKEKRFSNASVNGLLIAAGLGFVSSGCTFYVPVESTIVAPFFITVGQS